MAYSYHSDKKRYFNIQYLTTKDYIIPFLEQQHFLKQNSKVLEIGCAEAGVLKAFLEIGYRCTGIELDDSRVELAKEFMKEEFEQGRLDFFSKNVYDIDIDKDLPHKYDLIILKDVIEHIHDQERFIPKLKEFLNPAGAVFFAFPPWQMPYGGHQQVLESKFLATLPYYHLLPTAIYKGILKMFGESKAKIENRIDNKVTGISIERFERIVKHSGFVIKKKKFFFLNPIYKYKFGIDPKEQLDLVSSIPYIRNYLTTAVYYIIA